jgi:hypothetical protein
MSGLETLIAGVREAAAATRVAGDKVDLELFGLRAKTAKDQQSLKIYAPLDPPKTAQDDRRNQLTSRNVPPHVQAKRNADGTLRYYYRRRGRPSRRLPGEPGSPEFVAAYHAAELDDDPLPGGALSFMLSPADPLTAPLLVLLAALKSHDQPSAEKIFAHLLMTASLKIADGHGADELLRVALAMVRAAEPDKMSGHFVQDRTGQKGPTKCPRSAA